jgi:hypothetical protein
MLDSGPETVEDGRVGRGHEPARTTATTLSHPPARPSENRPRAAESRGSDDEPAPREAAAGLARRQSRASGASHASSSTGHRMRGHCAMSVARGCVRRISRSPQSRPPRRCHPRDRFRRHVTSRRASASATPRSFEPPPSARSLGHERARQHEPGPAGAPAGKDAPAPRRGRRPALRSHPGYCSARKQARGPVRRLPRARLCCRPCDARSHTTRELPDWRSTEMS